ncbi:hypothetical protein WJ0W_006717 [Paenibacillus melissococcoides]|uniref:Uncharacterized protein n=1 Tax=Paenibacillus melissococcoides TaxID=2912268 RepID=A0ABM9GBM4_9BACL|nr:hypothetical protein WJ0W_006717 [Paenibacillus melissococcoides]
MGQQISLFSLLQHSPCFGSSTSLASMLKQLLGSFCFLGHFSLFWRLFQGCFEAFWTEKDHPFGWSTGGM